VFKYKAVKHKLSKSIKKYQKTKKSLSDNGIKKSVDIFDLKKLMPFQFQYKLYVNFEVLSGSYATQPS